MIKVDYVLVAVGAALGGVTRYSLASWLNGYWHIFALGTLAANVLGGFLMGAFFGSSYFKNGDLKLLLATGFLGGLTTFSTFTLEGMQFLQQQKYGLFAAHSSLHLVLSLAMFMLGVYSVKLMMH